MGLDVTFYKMPTYETKFFVKEELEIILELRKPFVLHKKVMEMIDDEECFGLDYYHSRNSIGFDPDLWCPDFSISKQAMEDICHHCLLQDEEPETLRKLKNIRDCFDFQRYILLYSYC